MSVRDMGRKWRPKRAQVQIALLCLLIVKLGLTGIFVCTAEAPIPIPEVQENSASADDGGPLVQAPIPEVSAARPDDGTTAEMLEQKRAQIEVESRALEAERKHLEALKAEIDQKLVELTKIQEAIASKLTEQEAAQGNRVKHLIKIYSTMPPKKAAVLIEKLDMDVIIPLFMSMKGEQVGQILPYVSPEKAASISQRLAAKGP